MKEKISVTIDKDLLKSVDSLIDNLYIRNRSQAIEHLIKKTVDESKTAVILAGGPEERLKISKDEYRMFAKVDSESVVEKAVKTLRKNNFKEIFIIARHKMLTKVFSYFGNGNSYGVRINYIEEKESKGTFETLMLLKGKVNSKFLVVYDDIVFDRIKLKEFWDDHSRAHAVSTIMLTTSREPSKKGNVVVQGNRVLSFIQKPSKSDNYIVFSPIFIAEPELLDYQGSSLEKDVFPELARNNLLAGHLSPVKEVHIHRK
ncbi:MAG: sugar phosphate nucleotidyltransferase [Nanoarchaeota archaeon]|nr:sugar phosphate nucleotidyltransferase [Nanoarchaeota archaeon]